MKLKNLHYSNGQLWGFFVFITILFLSEIVIQQTKIQVLKSSKVDSLEIVRIIKLYDSLNSSEKQTFYSGSQNKAVASSKKIYTGSLSPTYDSKPQKKKYHFKKFNPNEMTTSDWKSFGFSDKQIGVIENYKKSVGGTFASKQQFLKCYVFSDLKDELASFVTVPVSKNLQKEKPLSLPKASEIEQKKVEKQTFVSSNKGTTEKTPINSAQGYHFYKYGISKKVAYRIVNFRDKIGRYDSIEQLYKVYDLPKETADSIWVDFLHD